VIPLPRAWLLTSALLVGTAVGLVAGIASTLLVKAVHPQAFGQAIGLTGRGGTIVFNGLPPGDFPAPIFDIVLKGLTIRGSIVGTRQDMAEALDFYARGLIHPTVASAGLDDINEVFGRKARPDRRPHRHRLPPGTTFAIGLTDDADCATTAQLPCLDRHRACPRRDSASDHRSPKEIRTFDRDAGAVRCRAVELVARDALTRGTLTTWATSSATMANRSKGCRPSAARVATRRSALNSSLSTRRSVTSLATPYTTASLAIFPGPARRRQTPR